MSDPIDELARLFERFPGIGPRQARRFVFYLLAVSEGERTILANVINAIGTRVHQCSECRRFSTDQGTLCFYCRDESREKTTLMIVEKDQDITALERAGSYRGRYFVLGGLLTLSGKGSIRDRELVARLPKRQEEGLEEIVLALSATSEGEHTEDHLRNLLSPFRDRIKITVLGRGLATGSELEYSDKETLTGAFQNRKEA